jgi:predicted O-linked N-acetylglucosamine transferase (SPINDLY family)
MSAKSNYQVSTGAIAGSIAPAQAIAHYEQQIAQQPDDLSAYWHLGIALLLQGNEEAAQISWMTPLLEAETEEQCAEWTAELVALLQTEADRQEAAAAYETAWLLQQHCQAFAPADWDSQLRILWLGLKTGFIHPDDESLAQIILQLDRPSCNADPNRLLQISQALLDCDPTHPATLEWLKAHARQVQVAPTDLIGLLLNALDAIAPRTSIAPLIQIGVQLADNDLKLLFGLLHRLQNRSVADRLYSIQLAEHCLNLSTTLTDRIIATNSLLSSWLFCGGNGQRASEIYQDFKTLVQALSQADCNPAEELGCLSLLAPIGGLFFYAEDNPRLNRPLRNQIGQLAQTHLQATLPDRVQRYQLSRPANREFRSPRIGYFAGSLRQHSVGWLCHWLLKYHDRSQFDIHLYSSRASDDYIQNQFRQEYGDRFHDVPSSIAEIADRIHDDQIDILIELDSLTSFGGCGVVALKPAPIQVHWLGYDASGIPAVDYFIADPYVLPDDAQAYYHETIWRLPHSYIAVDGFEIYPPSLRRDRLNIPGDAIVFLSSQTGLKRNIDSVRLQLRVIKAVPNSYFLIKSFHADAALTEVYFRDLAESEGVSGDRLCFLPDVPSEFVHRANLALADVVLDTYPYNGATTTLEALWMGLPIVTRVGEQFAARNSYTLMMNAGITEGLAWSDDEYLEWGIKLGTDETLRENIFSRLKRSRHTSPLWDGRGFARSMEQAYRQMWEKFNLEHQATSGSAPP